jgi:hypothetical protein
VSGRVARESGLLTTQELWSEVPEEGASFTAEGQGHVLFANKAAEGACVDYDDDSVDNWSACPGYDASSWCGD